MKIKGSQLSYDLSADPGIARGNFVILTRKMVRHHRVFLWRISNKKKALQNVSAKPVIF